MRQRTLLVPCALIVTALAVASCAQKRQTTEVQRPTATATGSSTGTGTGYAGQQGAQGGDNGSALPQGPSPAATPTPAPTPAPDSGPINQPDTAGFPDPTPPNNPSPPTPPNNPPPSNWSGAADDLPVNAGWAINSLDPGTKVASDGTVTNPGATTVPPTNAAGNGAATVGYDDRVASILNNNCVNGCHVQGGTQAGTAMDTFASAQPRGARIVARANGGGMPPNGPLSQGDIDALKAWEAGGFKQAGGAGATAGGNTAGQGLVLEISDQRYGNFLNDQKVVGKVGQTLKIVNKRSQGGFVIHTNGAPFDHGDVGNPIPPGGSKDYVLQSAYQGTTDVYEHTDGSVNTDRLIKLEVAP